MEVTNVTISIHVKPIPKSNLIVVKKVITGGAGELAEAIEGGQVRFTLKLKKGHEIGALKKGEDVFVAGTNADGDEFTLPFPLTTVSAHRPWDFTGEGGSPGP